jgi:hypothetical protein
MGSIHEILDSIGNTMTEIIVIEIQLTNDYLS